MSQEPFIEKQEQAVAMVGVCLTVIGILKLITSYGRIETIGDDITSFTALFFLAACFLSYTSMKTQNKKRRRFLEKAADTIFSSL